MYCGFISLELIGYVWLEIKCLIILYLISFIFSVDFFNYVRLLKIY